MDPELEKLRNAPLANALRINIPGGREALPPKPREKKEHMSAAEKEARGYLTTAQLRERKEQALAAKHAELYDYYAGTKLPAARVAEYMGVYRLEEDGTEEDGTTLKFKRVLDVGKVRTELSWRRKKSANDS